MRVFLDTNVVIDYATQRQPFCQAANAIFQLSQDGTIDACASALTFVTLAYILRKQVSKDEIYRCLRGITSIVAVAQTGNREIQQAIAAEWKDFEDAVQFSSAKSSAIDVILTRNQKDFQSTEILVMSPEDFLDKLI